MLELSEVLWSPFEQKNWSQFKDKIRVQTNRLGIIGTSVFTSKFLIIE